ncbi:MAG: cupin domain-containing protein [Pseudomonadales bacterium]|nr:cupin domain-containing protein [Pseudomonadales bacterium]
MKYLKLDKISDSPVSHNENISKKVLLSARECPNIMQLAQASFPAGEIAGGHKHDDMTEIFMIISGCGEIQIDAQIQKIEDGDTIVVEAGEYHELRNTGTEPLVVNYFSVLAL